MSASLATSTGNVVSRSADCGAGFGNFFNGYMWSLAVHDGWLYAGTNDWSVMLRWSTLREAPRKVVRFLNHLDPEVLIANASGADLWRSRDGENWMPVDRHGFGNPYNVGIRNLVSTPYGLFAGTANFFGPRVAVRHGSEWVYEDNPRGGLEVWHGTERSTGLIGALLFIGAAFFVALGCCGAAEISSAGTKLM